MYKPRINSQPSVESWNNHSMSSEGSRTSTQLYIQGFIESNALPVELSSPLAGNLQQLSAGDHVQVPRISFEPCALLFLLLSAIDPLQLSHYFGHDIHTNCW